MFALSAPIVCVFDSAVSAPAVRCAPSPIFASLVTIATLTPIAAPMVLPVAPPVVTADPSAFAVESVLAFARSVSAEVPALIVRPAGIVAFWSTMLIVTAIAAATCSGLLSPESPCSDVSALGVDFAFPTLFALVAPPVSPAFF